MKRTIVLLFLIIGTGIKAQTPNRPHIFIILADDLGYGDLGITGHPNIKTPHLDSFALKSRRLRMYSAHPVCSPSRIGLLTGQFPQRMGISSIVQVQGDDNFELKPTDPTLPQILRDTGYFTFQVGKWHLTKTRNQAIVQALGFQSYHVKTNTSAWYHFNVSRDFISQSLAQNPDKPIFGYIAVNEPHTPTVPKLPPPQDTIISYYGYDTITTLNTCHLGNESGYLENLQAHADKIKYYYGVVSNLDKAFGNFIQFLDSIGILSNSIILFSSDNGPEENPEAWGTAGCGMSGIKRQIYEGGLRVPGFIHWQGRWEDGDTVTTPTSFVDIMPTLAAVTGAIVPNAGELDGENMLDVWDKTTHTRHKPLYWMYLKTTQRDASYGNLGKFNGHIGFMSPDGRNKLVTQLECLPPAENIAVGEFMRRASGEGRLTNYQFFDLLIDPIEMFNARNVLPNEFRKLKSDFYKYDRQLRRSAPPYLDEKGRANSIKPQCNNNTLPLFCPADTVFVTTPTMLNFAESLAIDNCGNLGCPNLMIHQWPDAGTIITDSSTLVEINYLQNGDHVKYCRVVVMIGIKNLSIELLDKKNQNNCDSPDGLIAVSAEGGVIPYTYQWSNGATTAIITDLSGGDYEVTVSDAQGNQVTATFKIENVFLNNATVYPPTLTVDCKDTFSLAATGGTSYQWSHNLGSTPAVTTAINESTDFTVTISNDFGCTTTITLPVKVTEPIINDLKVVTNCKNGSAVLYWSADPSSEYVVNWWQVGTNDFNLSSVTGQIHFEIPGLSEGKMYSAQVKEVCSDATPFSEPIIWNQPICPIFQIAPNPVTSVALVETKIAQDDVEAELIILSIDGNLQYRVKQVKHGDKIDMRSWPAGVYAFKFSYSAGSVIQMVLKRS